MATDQGEKPARKHAASKQPAKQPCAEQPSPADTSLQTFRASDIQAQMARKRSGASVAASDKASAKGQAAGQSVPVNPSDTGHARRADADKYSLGFSCIEGILEHESLEQVQARIARIQADIQDFQDSAPDNKTRAQGRKVHAALTHAQNLLRYLFDTKQAMLEAQIKQRKPSKPQGG